MKVNLNPGNVTVLTRWMLLSNPLQLILLPNRKLLSSLTQNYTLNSLYLIFLAQWTSLLTTWTFLSYPTERCLKPTLIHYSYS